MAQFFPSIIDFVIVESVDDNYNPVKSGEAGSKVLLTNLYNFSLPLIRYEIENIRVIFRDKCSCGSAFPLVELKMIEQNYGY